MFLSLQQDIFPHCIASVCVLCVPSLQIQGFCFLMSTLLIARAQSSWGQDQWSDVSLHPPIPTHTHKSAAQTCSNNSSKKKQQRPVEATGSGDDMKNRRDQTLTRRKLVSPFHSHKFKYYLTLSSMNSSSQKVVLFVR